MTEHDSPEAIAQRGSQKDPLIMHFIVRESLNMSTGKIAAQCAHAAQMQLLNYYTLQSMCNVLTNKTEISQASSDAIDIFQKWLNSSFRKVVLVADEREWNKVKADILPIDRMTVIDNGLTEVPSGSETVIVLFPMYKSQVPKVIKRLQVLK
jgi:peptidyl-tRNA hydrolase